MHVCSPWQITTDYKDRILTRYDFVRRLIRIFLGFSLIHHIWNLQFVDFKRQVFDCSFGTRLIICRLQNPRYRYCCWGRLHFFLLAVGSYRCYFRTNNRVESFAIRFEFVINEDGRVLFLRSVSTGKRRRRVWHVYRNRMKGTKRLRLEKHSVAVVGGSSCVAKNKKK